MTRRGLVLFGLMSVIWGIPYLFIRVTVAEIAALRYVGTQLEAAGERKRLVALTTSIVSGRSMMDAVMEKKNFAAVSSAPK